MNTLNYQTLRPYRLIFGATFFAGMAMCSRGLSQGLERGWLHPITLLGTALGIVLLGLGVSVLFRRSVGPVTSDRNALFALLVLMAVKLVLGRMYALVP
jgi:hypothetical protein